MVRAVHYGPQFSAQLSSLCGRGAATGLVLGSHTDNDRSFGVCLVETPKGRNGSQAPSSWTLVVGDTESCLQEVQEGEAGDQEVSTSRGLDVTWMLEHAKQVYRLMPGQARSSDVKSQTLRLVYVLQEV